MGFKQAFKGLNISVGVTDVVLFNYSLLTAEIIRAEFFILRLF
jgi:hypothetical protein